MGMSIHEIASLALPDSEMNDYVFGLIANGILAEEVDLTDAELLMAHAEPLVPRLRRTHIEITMTLRGAEQMVLVVKNDQDAAVFLKVFGLGSLDLLPMVPQPAAKRHLLVTELEL